MAKSPKVSSSASVILYSVAGIVDVAQIIIDFTGVGIVVSEILEVLMIPILLGSFKLLGISIFSKPARLLSILGVAAGDAITGGIAPFWCLDVWYVLRSVRKEEAESHQQTQPKLYEDGRGRPRGNAIEPPLNTGDRREPSGHIVRV